MTKNKDAPDGMSDEAALTDPKKSPGEWAVICGQTQKVRNPALRGQTLYRAAHAAADVVHGWTRYEYHQAKPFQLTRKDYEASLAAAMKHSPKGLPSAHSAANAGA